MSHPQPGLTGAGISDGRQANRNATNGLVCRDTDRHDAGPEELRVSSALAVWDVEQAA